MHEDLAEVLFDNDHFNVFYDFNPKGCRRIDPDDEEILTCLFDIIARDNADPTELFNNFGIMFNASHNDDIWYYEYDTITKDELLADLGFDA